MLRIGICDDVYDARLVLRAALERAAEKRRITAAFFEFSAGENLLRWLEGAEVYFAGGASLPVSRSCRQGALLAMARAELGD